MAIIRIVTPFNIDLEFKIAAFAKRAGAWAIDLLVISSYYYTMISVIYPLINMDTELNTVVDVFILALPVMLYQLCFEIFLNGQTIGKKIVGIKIIDKEGQEPTWGQFIIRWMLCLGNIYIYILPKVIINLFALTFVCLFLYLPDVICMLISSKGQRIGDIAAGTVVIDANYAPDINETIYQEIEVRDYQPLFPQVMQLTDRDINGIRNLLQVKRQTRDTDLYMQQIVHKIKSVLQVESDLPAHDFLQQLLHDYNFMVSKGERQA